MTRQKWVRLSVSRLQILLAGRGYPLDTSTVRRLLLEMGVVTPLGIRCTFLGRKRAKNPARKLPGVTTEMGYSLKSNRKRFTGPPHPDRDCQFGYIARMKKRFLAAGWPVLSVDTKKKELIGNFKNPGQSWCEQAEEVNAHDFPQDALARATPYGIYLPALDLGFVYVGLSRDTPAFAVDAISLWWQDHGLHLFGPARRLLILADAGGSNGCRPRLWKYALQQLADREGLTITVCHYPQGASKWNPIEHRLFSYISINWAGKPLRTVETMLGYIRGTETQVGLKVQAVLLPGLYPTGVKVSKQQWKTMRLHRHKTCPSWNYTISPHRRKLS